MIIIKIVNFPESVYQRNVQKATLPLKPVFGRVRWTKITYLNFIPMTNAVKVEKAPHSEVKINVKLSEAEFKKYKDKALEQLGKNVKVKGFRPGHVPQDVLEEQVNKQAVLGLAIEMAMDATYRDAVVKEKVQVLTPPKVKVESEDPLEYTATAAVKPEVSVKDYKKIKVSVKEQKISDKEFKEALDDLLKGKGTWHDVDRKAKKEDRAELNFQGYEGTKVEEGKELENTNSKNHPLILGSNTFIPGFEDEVIGMKVGETKDFTLTFPKDYHSKDFQGKKVTFQVELSRLEEQKLPEYNEEFIKEATNGAKSDKKEFEDYVKEVLLQKKQEDARGAAESELIEKILKATKVDFSPMLTENETQVIFNDFKKQVESRGITFEKHLELTGQKPEDLKKGMSEEAERRVTMRFALDHIIEQEKFEVSEADFKKELELIKERYPEAEHSKIDEYYKEGAEGNIRLKNMMIVGKVFEMYLKK